MESKNSVDHSLSLSAWKQTNSAKESLNPANLWNWNREPMQDANDGLEIAASELER
jgi:hypothetical protein